MKRNAFITNYTKIYLFKSGRNQAPATNRSSVPGAETGDFLITRGIFAQYAGVS